MFKNLIKSQGSILLGLLLVMLIIVMLLFGFSFFGGDEGRQGQIESYQNTLEDLNEFKLEYDEAQRQQLEMIEE